MKYVGINMFIRYEMPAVVLLQTFQPQPFDAFSFSSINSFTTNVKSVFTCRGPKPNSNFS